MGTGSVTHGRSGRVVYCMRVEGSLSFDEYWRDERFVEKKPLLVGSQKQWYGDNIYYRNNEASWVQLDSHHSRPGGVTDEENLRKDTKVDRVLFSRRFVYWGGTGPNVPTQLRNWNGVDIVHKGRGHRSQFPADLAAAFGEWIEPHLGEGRVGRPRDWT